MAQLLVRDLDDQVMARLKERARRNRRSLQAEARAILEAAAPRYTKEEALANALWKKQLRREVEDTAAASILENFRRVAIETFALMRLLPTAFAIASAAGHSVHDCLYLALAEREDCPLVTADRRFYQAFAGGHLGHRMRWIEAFDS